MSLSDNKLVRVFYQPVNDIAMLLVQSFVDDNLNPLQMVRGDIKTWKADCSLPTQVHKLWADLFEHRKNLQRNPGLRSSSKPSTNKDLVEGCLYFYTNIDRIVEGVHLLCAGQYIFKIIHANEHIRDTHVMLWHEGKYKEALAEYFKHKIDTSLREDDPVFIAPEVDPICVCF